MKKSLRERGFSEDGYQNKMKDAYLEQTKKKHKQLNLIRNIRNT